jgi:uncharacterized membrane protein HdeD (DUF308 family)
MSKSKLKLVLVATVIGIAIIFLGAALIQAMDLIERQSDLINLTNFK